MKTHNPNPPRSLRNAPASSQPRQLGEAANGGNFVDDVMLARQPIVGMLLQDVERLLGELTSAESGAAAPLNLSASGNRRRWVGRGVRQFLRESEGDGYWDLFKLSDFVIVSVTDATYHKPAWVTVEGSSFFKLRILLSGTLQSETGEVVARAPQAMLSVSPGPSRGGYFIAPSEPLRMLVLHCRPDLITHVLGLEPSEVPPPLDTMFLAGHPPSRHRLAPGPEAMHAAQRILQSRHQLSRSLRGPYLEAVSMEILLHVIGELANMEMTRRTSSTFSARDLNCIFEARDYLAQHFSRPPTIPELARLAGVNQTKLKAGFRKAVGLTIYDYILKCRMERAAELLLTGDYGVAEVAYEVGYDYPANFTHAFRRFHGKLPGDLKREGNSAHDFARVKVPSG